MASTSPTRRLRILMLHGYTQSGELFHVKTRTIEKALEKAFLSPTIRSKLPDIPISGVDLIYPTAPHALVPVDMPVWQYVKPEDGPTHTDKWGWWRMRDYCAEYIGLEDGLEEGLNRIADTLRTHGPVDGVIGFSQGAATAALVASLLDPGRREIFERTRGSVPYPESFIGLNHPPLEFVVCYSGFVAELEEYRAFYEPKIQTPVLHIIGGLDCVVEESWTRRLIGCFESGAPDVVRHSGGHFVPAGKREVAALIAFIQRTLPAKYDEMMMNDDGRIMDMIVS